MLPNRIGTTIGRWKIEGVLGEGGMSMVYLARDREGRAVAIKILGRDHAGDRHMRNKFLREARIARAIDHPACVKVESAITLDSGEPAIVMERVEGESLEKIWRRLGRRVPHGSALRMAEKILSFLEACHAAGVVHCDIKPTNVVVAHDGGLKVLDYGIACAAALEPQGSTADVTMGTPYFMPPEQVTGDPRALDARADVFAVGATLYSLMTGVLLHKGKTHDESLVLAASKRVPSLAAADEALWFPDAVVEIVDRALSFRREDRFPTARAMRDKVQHFLAEEQLRRSMEARAVELRDGDESGERIKAQVSWTTRHVHGELKTTPLPHVLRGAAARALTGSLLLTDAEGRRHRLLVRDGGPILRLVELERLGPLGAAGTFEFFVDDGSVTADTTGVPIDPLAAILAVTRAAPASVYRKTLDALRSRSLQLHPAARLDRFLLRDEELRAIETAHELQMTYGELVEAELAPQAAVDPVVFALGLTRHMPMGVAGAWPLCVTKS
jgi:serine/threonine-protein kinase